MKCNGCLQERVTKPFINYSGQKSQLCRSCFRAAEKAIKDLYDQSKKRRRGDILRKKAVKKWNNDVHSELLHKFMEEEKESWKKEASIFFYWSQLVWQEIDAWCMDAKQVKQDDFDFICNRRGFDQLMRSYLFKMVKYIGLGIQLKNEFVVEEKNENKN